MAGPTIEQQYAEMLVRRAGVVVLNPVQTSMADSASVGAFGRLRVANPLTLWDTQFQYGKQPLSWEEVTQGGASAATHLPNESAISFAVASGSSDFVFRQTHNYLRYKPGKSQLVVTTGNLGGHQAGQYRRMGYFDADNGVFLESDGVNVNIVLRSRVTGSVVETRVPQSSWNLNKFDTGDLNLDPANAQIFAVDLEWLGVGRVRAGFFIGGDLVYAHEFLHANMSTTTYMTTANLPVRYEARNFAAQSGTTTGFKQICSTVISEGGESSIIADQIRAASTSLTTPLVIPDSGFVPVISVRLKSTVNGIANRGLIKPMGLDSLITASKNVYWEVLLNPTINSTSWLSTDAESIAEYNLDATTVSGGYRLSNGYAAGVNQSKGSSPSDLSSKVYLSRNHNNTSSDIVTLAMRSLSAPDSNGYASIQWAELI